MEGAHQALQNPPAVLIGNDQIASRGLRKSTTDAPRVDQSVVPVTGIEVRRVRPSDVVILRATRLRALADAPAAFGRTVSEAEARPVEFWTGQASGRLGDRPCATWVATDSTGDGVGMITGVEQVDTVDIIQVWVAPEHRGSGLVERLFAALFEWAPHQRIDIAVALSNDRARAAYVRLGFQRVGDHPGRRETDVEMTHTLTATRTGQRS